MTDLDKLIALAQRHVFEGRRIKQQRIRVIRGDGSAADALKLLRFFVRQGGQHANIPPGHLASMVWPPWSRWVPKMHT